MENGQVLTVEEQNKYLKELEEKGQVIVEEILYFKDRTTIEECIERIFAGNKLKSKKINWKLDNCFNPINALLGEGIKIIYTINNIEFIITDYRNLNFVQYGDFKLETVDHFANNILQRYLKELQEGYLNKEMSLWDLDSIRNEDYFGLSECESKKVHTFSFLKKGIMFYVSFTITKLVVNTKDFFEYDEIEIDLDKLSDDEEITIEKLERITGKEIEKINWDESRCIITEIGLN